VPPQGLAGFHPGAREGGKAMWQTLVKILKNPTVQGVLVTVAMLVVESLVTPASDAAQKR